MQIKRLEVGEMGTNCYLAWCEKTNLALVIDPGSDSERILRAVRNLELKVKYIVNTHGHLDHIGANRNLHDVLNCPIAIGEDDSIMLTSPKHNLSSQIGQPVTSPDADILLAQGDKLEFGSCVLEVFDTPGHTPGGICLYGHGILFAGDTLFQRSIGRSDLPGGNHDQLIKSIQTKLLALPDVTRVLPGHGPETTISEERVHNPWLQG